MSNKQKDKDNPLKNEFKDLITEKHYRRYHKCLQKYKEHLRKLYDQQEQEKKQIKNELANLLNIEKDYFSDYYKGGKKGGKKKIPSKSTFIGSKSKPALFEKDSKFLNRCIRNFAKDLDKEEKLLKQRIKRVQMTKRSLLSNVNEVI